MSPWEVQYVTLLKFSPRYFVCQTLPNSVVFFVACRLCVSFCDQDLLALKEEYTTRPAAEETINDPTNPKHYWRYRMY